MWDFPEPAVKPAPHYGGLVAAKVAPHYDVQIAVKTANLHGVLAVVKPAVMTGYALPVLAARRITAKFISACSCLLTFTSELMHTVGKY